MSTRQLTQSFIANIIVETIAMPEPGFSLQFHSSIIVLGLTLHFRSQTCSRRQLSSPDLMTETNTLLLIELPHVHYFALYITFFLSFSSLSER